MTPALRAQYRTSGEMLPSARGGVAITMVLQPAMPAGTASMSALEGSTAVPPGTYTPTAPAGVHSSLDTCTLLLWRTLAHSRVGAGSVLAKMGSPASTSCKVRRLFLIHASHLHMLGTLAAEN